MRKRKLKRWVIVSLDFIRIMLIFCLLMQTLWVACICADTLAYSIVWCLSKLCQLFGIMPI